MQTLKDAIRAVIHLLPNNLPIVLLPYCVYFATSRINLVRSKGGILGVSPREALTGVMPNLAKEVRAGSCDYTIKS